MFQTRLKEARETAGYKSQQAFASALGTVQSTVGGWESGTREPNIEKIVKIAELLDVSTDYLLGRGSALTPQKEEHRQADFTFLTSEYRADIDEDFRNANDEGKLVILKTFGVPPSLLGYFNANVNPNPPKAELDEDAYQVGIAFAKADDGTKSAVRKLLDISAKIKTPTRRHA